MILDSADLSVDYIALQCVYPVKNYLVDRKLTIELSSCVDRPLVINYV